MTMLAGRKALVFGVLNEDSLAWHVANQLHQLGCALAFTHQPGDQYATRATKATAGFAPLFVTPCDVARDEDLASAAALAEQHCGAVDYLVHSVAFAPADAFSDPFLETKRATWTTALDVSAYSLVAMSRALIPVMKPGGSIVTMTFAGSQRYYQHYNVMGVAKAALEATVRYLAAELGRHSKRIRVNAISAGPVKTLAARGTGVAGPMFRRYQERAPLPWTEEAGAQIGTSAVYLLSDWAAAVTGETHYVDAGYNIMGT